MSLADATRRRGLERLATRSGVWAIGALAADGTVADLIDLAAAGVVVYALAGAGAGDLARERRMVLRLRGLYGAGAAALRGLLLLGAAVAVRYTGALRSIELHGVVAATLDADTDREVVTILAVDPRWRALAAESVALATTQTIASSGRVFVRAADGVWTATNGPGAAVLVMAYGPDGNLYAGLDGAPGVQVWDGTAWATVGGGIAGAVYALCWQGSRLYAGGSFAAAGGGAAVNVAAYDTGGWHALGAGCPGGVVRVLAAHHEGFTAYVLVGGTFTGFHKVWVDAGAWSAAPAVNGAVTGYVSLPDGYLLAGAFTTVGGAARPYRAVISAVFGTVTALAGVAAPLPLVGAYVLPDSRILLVDQDGATSAWNGYAVQALDWYTTGGIPCVLGATAAGLLWVQDGDGVAWVRGASVHPLDYESTVINLSTVALAVHADGRLALAQSAATGLLVPGRTALLVDATAPTPAQVVFTVVGGRWMAGDWMNTTTGRGFAFAPNTMLVSAVVVDGAALAVQDPSGRITVGDLLADSQYPVLVPGANVVAVGRGYPSAGVAVSLVYVARYTSIEAADG